MDTTPYVGKWVEQEASYNQRDLLLYAVGIGCEDLRFTFENDMDFEAFPTYIFAALFKGVSQDVVMFPSPFMFEGPELPPLPGIRTALDGERSLEVFAPLNPEGGKLRVRSRIIGIHARGSGASVETEAIVTDADTGEKVFRLVSSAFLVGAKDFKDAGVSNSEKIDPPNREPDSIVEMPVGKTQVCVSLEHIPLYYSSQQISINPNHPSNKQAPTNQPTEPCVPTLWRLQPAPHRP